MSLNVENTNTLIAYLEARPVKSFNMGWQYFEQHPCGTAACLHGHSYVLWKGVYDGFDVALGISDKYYDELTMPVGWSEEKTKVRRYPLIRAIATLKRLRDHYLATGEIVVDWGKEPGEPGWDGEIAETQAPWSPPVVTAGLPESLTRHLTGASLADAEV